MNPRSPARAALDWACRSRPAHVAALVLLSLAYRATFLAQAFAPTDEGWVQAMGLRIARGEVPYRDFYYIYPPFTIFREAAGVVLLGTHYTVLASRWVFSLEVALASVCAYLLLSRLVAPLAALLATLPTAFFTVQLIYMSNYTYDAEVAAVAAVSLAFVRHPLALAAAAVATAVSLLSKQPFVLLLPLLLLAAGAALAFDGSEPVRAFRRQAPLVVAGGAVLAALPMLLLAASAGPSRVAYDVLTLTRQGHPSPLSFYLWQDLPDYLRYWGPAAPAAAALIAAAALGGRSRALRRLGLVLGLVAMVLALQQTRGQQPARPFADVTALWVILALNLLALLLGAWAWRRGAGPAAQAARAALLPPELPLLALGLQYMAQYTYSGAVFFYLGTFLSVPVAVLTLYGLARAGLPVLGSSRVAAPALAAWLALAAVLVLHYAPYEDAPRAELTASLHAGRLDGLVTRPEEAAKLTAMVAAIDRYSAPGDPVFVFPDNAVLYFSTDRVNPTPEDWYNRSMLTPAIAAEAAADLARRPPRVVLLQTMTEGDFKSPQPPLDYAGEPRWAPIHSYLVAHYHEVARVQDVVVMLPNR